MMCLAAIAMTALTASAQDKVEGTISTDVVNQYIWRGQDLGDVSIQPTLGIAYKGFSLSAWGNVGLSDKDDTKELDLTATYTTGGFHIGVTDYWFNSPNDKYFAYKAHETSHVFEGNIGYDFGPLAVNWYTNFAGNDGVNKHRIEGLQGHRDHQILLCSTFRRHLCQPQHPEGLLHFRLHTASITHNRQQEQPANKNKKQRGDLLSEAPPL